MAPSVAENVPAAQGVATEAPVAVYFPTAALEQIVTPAVAEYVPAAHGLGIEGENKGYENSLMH